jgi:hypothetical protein
MEQYDLMQWINTYFRAMRFPASWMPAALCQGEPGQVQHWRVLVGKRVIVSQSFYWSPVAFESVPLHTVLGASRPAILSVRSAIHRHREGLPSMVRWQSRLHWIRLSSAKPKGSRHGIMHVADAKASRILYTRCNRMAASHL